ncbi:ubiquinol oxidase subunit II [Candidatus Blochmanniella camponoti]|uniref:Ubiquinol oxidase subunit 2 n=1 Tax=Candidatus Blochmanniella camponoti TaxID=108080 RepID=A0AAE9I7V2_9ENTR|nr:ubiquinol oxidase subunit II [Candidatus Blochmannia herculeanus]URJ24666.1 ubiquinol oxidase subunit II [Candidatus Blochmannia herculeanus]URJ26726.1 ubiquinol oxidase subunit II [Candidatus Blochmannia herculeanus]URJ27469.1 ubiquinol oxidase subunit II [Candidatus Blochmannia herculeanus]
MKFSVRKHRKICISLLLHSLIIVLNGCSDLVLLHPKGQIGIEERSLILTAFGLMLSIVVPVIVMTIFFTIKYRASNLRNTQYSPNWVNSKEIEFIVWAVPILIIIFLGAVTWKSTHKLDPKNPIVSSAEQPIIINVISLDWKWLFIYPKQNIAVVNELVFPAHIPIKFNVTSNSVMNSFFIPQLGGQIYAMAGMRTELYLIANAAGRYKGISSNFSGQGFSGMKFTVVATQTKQEFEQWIQTAQKSSHQINNMSIYEELAKPSEYHPIIYFSNVQPNLFNNVIDKFTHQKKEYF